VEAWWSKVFVVRAPLTPAPAATGSRWTRSSAGSGTAVSGLRMWVFPRGGGATADLPTRS